MKFLSFLTIFSSCASVNQESKDYYQQKHHGFKILSQTEISEVGSSFTKVDIKKANRGKILFEKSCVQCHGEKGLGDGTQSDAKRPAANLVKLAQKNPHFRFYYNASQWKGKMPGWKVSLTEKEKEDLRHHILNLSLQK